MNSTVHAYLLQRVSNICLVLFNDGIRFGAFEDVSVKIYMPSVCRNQNVGNVN